MAIRKFGTVPAVPQEEHDARLRELGRAWFKEAREQSRMETEKAGRRGENGGDGGVGDGFSLLDLFDSGDSDGGDGGGD